MNDYDIDGFVAHIIVCRPKYDAQKSKAVVEYRTNRSTILRIRTKTNFGIGVYPFESRVDADDFHRFLVPVDNGIRT